MKFDHDKFINLYKSQCGALDNKKVATTDSSEANSPPLRAETPSKQGREQFNHFLTIVRGGMHQPVE